MSRDLEMLVTVRRPELLDAATLTLQTVRTGFPEGRLVVFGNDLDAYTADIVDRRASQAGGEFHNLTRQRHDLWLLWRLESSTADELVILDGDLVFHREMEHWPWGGGRVLFGPHEPQHRNPVTGAIHQARIHTCLWFCIPAALRRRMADYKAGLPRVPWPMNWHPTAQAWIPGAPPLFYDTGAQLCRVLGASAIPSNPDNDPFTHLHCGTWSDVAAAHLPDLPALHAAAAAGRLTETDYAGIRQQQAQWYADHAA